MKQVRTIEKAPARVRLIGAGIAVFSLAACAAGAEPMVTVELNPQVRCQTIVGWGKTTPWLPAAPLLRKSTRVQGAQGVGRSLLEARMVHLDRQRRGHCRLAVANQRQPRAGRPVVNAFRLTSQAFLEQLPILAPVVQQSCESGLVTQAEWRGELSGALRRRPQVFFERLRPPRRVDAVRQEDTAVLVNHVSVPSFVPGAPVPGSPQGLKNSVIVRAPSDIRTGRTPGRLC